MQPWRAGGWTVRPPEKQRGLLRRSGDATTAVRLSVVSCHFRHQGRLR